MNTTPESETLGYSPTISVKFKPSDQRKLEDLARIHRVNRSEYIRQAVLDRIQADLDKSIEFKVGENA